MNDSSPGSFRGGCDRLGPLPSWKIRCVHPSRRVSVGVCLWAEIAPVLFLMITSCSVWLGYLVGLPLRPKYPVVGQNQLCNRIHAWISAVWSLRSDRALQLEPLVHIRLEHLISFKKKVQVEGLVSDVRRIDQA